MRLQSRLAVALLGGASALVMASGADAQSASEVVVTGSRVIRNGDNSPVPVTVVTTEEMQAVVPSTLSDIVNAMPQLQGSQTSATSGTGIRNGSAAYLTLRNAGDNHTLVLWDGHRLQPTTSQESHASDVDINVIPQMLIQRVDVVTGGVSAVYGSDAVTGVVNFITDTKFNGWKVNLSSGVSSEGDGRQFSGGVAGGGRILNDRGHVEFSYEYRDDDGLLDRLSREIYANPPGYAGNGGTVPFTQTRNIRTGNQSFVGLVTSGPLNGLQFSQNGTVAPFVHGTLTGVTNQEIGGDGAWNRLSSIKSTLNQQQMFGRFDYDLTDNLHAYAQVAATNIRNTNVSTPSVVTLAIGYNNPFLNSIQQPYQGQLATQRALTPNGSFNFTKTLENIPQRINSDTYYNMYVAGLSGDIAGYTWEVSAQHAESSVKVRNTGNIDMAHLLAAANAVVNPANGQTVCNAALTNAAYANCVPINLFGPTSESQAALYYVTGLTASDALSIFNDISGTITGSPFATWAGPVNMAVSGEWRRLDYHLDSYTQPGDLADCSGIQFSCTQGTQVRWLNNTLSNRSRVNERVAEVAYEADVPLIADKPFFQAFNVNGAVRYTNYATSGGVTTWKLGADWSINDEVKLRATRSRDIRAPNLNDLYNPAQPNRSSRFDLHTNTTNITSAVANSNPDLVPEEADTYTVGAVYRPSFLPGLNLSVDGYHIKVNDAIIVVSGTNSQVQQACEDSAGTSPLCDLFIRPLPFSNHTAANFPTQMSGAPLNIASIETYGLDFEAGYATEVFSRPLNLRALVAYQPHLIYDAGPSGKADIAGTNGGQIGYGNSSSSPAVKLTAIAKYDVTDNLSVTVMERWRGEMAASANNTLVYTTGGTVPSIAYTNLNVAYKFGTMGGDTELYLNVQNLFDKYPEGFGLSSGDDQVGRYFTVGLRSKF